MPHAARTIPIISNVTRVGACNRFCGRCCSVAFWRTHPAWETIAPQFAALGEKENGDCANLEWVQGQAVCRIYDERPEMCRAFPNHPLSIDQLPDCTFQFRLTEEGEHA